MDDFKKVNLMKQWDNIVKDLQVDHILDELYSLQVVSTDDLESIRNNNPRKERVNRLLGIISKKDNRTYDNFVHVLQRDYEWLYKALQHADEESHDGLERQVFQDALVLGDVPRQPPHYVDRVAPLHTLRGHLEELEPCQRIVLHGMTGSGKSCLAASALKDPFLLKKCFRNRVFWINLGDVKTEDQLPSHMNVLLRRLTSDSRIQTNRSRPVSFLTTQDDDVNVEIRLLRDALKNTFCADSYRESLLVLDNVSLKEATAAFDVGCKTLVTTQDKDIVFGNNTIYMQVKGGFTELETLTLFANCLKTNTEKLPCQANQIHYLCKGEPILIALIGTLLEQYKEDLLTSSKHWNYYITKLTNKEYNLKDQLFRAIRICVDRLEPSLRELYKSFTVFVEDVNITPHVMQTLWNLDDIYSVQDKLTKLQNKSLIVSYYNQEMRSYVYGVHDLFLAYLKEQLDSNEIIGQHQKLINAYKKISHDNFANLPNDNYIFQYIGYHLKQAKLYDEFRVYFDLNFIGAKIKAIGIADLLRDFILYQKYITRNDEALIKKSNEYVNFIKARGHDLFKYRDIDIIQSGLGQDKDTSIYAEALTIARRNPQYLYFQLQAPPESVYFTHTLDLRHDVSAACFTSDVNQILVGMRNGDINLWEQPYNRKLNVFSGHTGSIVHLRLSPNANGFLSVSEDGFVKIWNLEGVVIRNSNGDLYDENGFDKNIPSPRVKQANWMNFYGSAGRVDHSKTCKLENDKLISASYPNTNSYYVVTGCSNGRVLIWNIEDEEPQIDLDIHGHGQPVNCVTFSSDDTLVIFSCDTGIFLYDASNGEFLSQFRNRAIMKSLLIVPELDTTLIAMNERTVTMWTWNQVGLEIKEPTMNELNIKGEANFLCGAVTEDGMYFVAGSTDHYIRIWHIGTAKIVEEILNNKGLVVCLDTFYDDTQSSVHILLSGSDDKTVKQWHIQPTLKDKDTAKLLPIFDCFWNHNSTVPRIAVVNTKNSIQIMNGHNIIIESDIMSSPIKAVRFSLCGNKIAIGLENGDIKEFDYKNRHYEYLMTLHDSIVLLKYFCINTENGCKNYSRNDLTSDNVFLIATARNGWVNVYRNSRNFCLIQPSITIGVLKQVPVIPIVQCFYIKAAGKLLSVSENRTIKSWDIDDGSCDILCGDKIQHSDDSNNAVVTMATLSKDQSLLAITMSDGCFEIHSLNIQNSIVSVNYNQGKCLNNSLRSCRFSHNGRLLALGQDNGNILIWSVETKIELGTLQLHKTCVRYLLFSPAPALILISVGEQIGWWDITKMESEIQKGETRNYRRRSNSAKKDLRLDLSIQPTNFNLGLWNNKEGRNNNKRHLLSAIKVRGLFSTYISASHDFTSFFTIDKNGYLYIMEMLKQSNI